MQASIQSAFTQHLWDIALLFHELACRLKAILEEPSRYQGGCHHLRRRHLDLFIVAKLHSFQVVITNHKNRGNFGLHGWPLIPGVLLKPSVTIGQPCVFGVYQVASHVNLMPLAVVTVLVTRPVYVADAEDFTDDACSSCRGVPRNPREIRVIRD